MRYVESLIITNVVIKAGQHLISIKWVKKMNHTLISYISYFRNLYRDLEAKRMRAKINALIYVIASSFAAQMLSVMIN